MTNKHIIKQLITKTALVLTVTAMVAGLFGGIAHADFEIPTVDQGEVDRMFDDTAKGPGSEGCDDLKSDIGQAKNQVRTWNSEREAASTWQHKALLTIKINNGLRWIKYASIIYETNCSWANFGGMEVPMS